MIYETDFKVYSSIYFGYSIRFWPWLVQQMLDGGTRDNDNFLWKIYRGMLHGYN